jgi:hypothetical protein
MVGWDILLIVAAVLATIGLIYRLRQVRVLYVFGLWRTEPLKALAVALPLAAGMVALWMENYFSHWRGAVLYLVGGGCIVAAVEIAHTFARKAGVEPLAANRENDALVTEAPLPQPEPHSAKLSSSENAARPQPNSSWKSVRPILVRWAQVDVVFAIAMLITAIIHHKLFFYVVFAVAVVVSVILGCFISTMKQAASANEISRPSSN